MAYKLGIDVGGTNTDGAILDEQMNVISSFKSPTTDDIESGIKNVIEMLLDDIDFDKSEITHAMLGTTQCTNAIVTRKGLNSVGVIRTGAPARTAVEPLYSMPGALLNVIGENTFQVRGGHEFKGELIAELDEEMIRTIANGLKATVSLS